MMYDWVFLDKDGSKEEVSLEETSEPIPGDGKIYKGREYTVRHVVSGRTTTSDPAVIATEN